MIDILGKRYYFFAVSLVVILPGLVLLGIMAVNDDLPLAIDFTGGSLLEVEFETSSPLPADIVTLYGDLGIEDVSVQTTGEGTFVIRSSVLDEVNRSIVIAGLEDAYGTMVVLRFDSVGPTIGAEVTARAAQAVAVAAIIVVIYMTFAFRGVPNAIRFGICAILAMIHDIAVVFSLTAIGSYFWGWQFDSLFLTALLTVIGFSVQDKIVVFDRVRENTGILRNLPFETLGVGKVYLP